LLNIIAVVEAFHTYLELPQACPCKIVALRCPATGRLTSLVDRMAIFPDLLATLRDGDKSVVCLSGFHRRLTRLEDAVNLLVGWSRDFFDSRTVQRDFAESVLLL
jgi:hypothetical protein